MILLKKEAGPVQAARESAVPTALKRRAEEKSGLAMDTVRVHYASQKPGQLGALAYAQGEHIYLGPGQESCLPHELAHVVQQKQGRVPVTSVSQGVALNDDPALEREADAFALRRMPPPAAAAQVAQRVIIVTPNPRNPSMKVKISKFDDLIAMCQNPKLQKFDVESLHLSDWQAVVVQGVKDTGPPKGIHDESIISKIVERLDMDIAAYNGPEMTIEEMGAWLGSHCNMAFFNRVKVALTSIPPSERPKGKVTHWFGCPMCINPQQGGAYSKPGGVIYPFYLTTLGGQAGEIPPQLMLGHAGGDKEKEFSVNIPGLGDFVLAICVHMDISMETKYGKKLHGYKPYEIVQSFGFATDFLKPGDYIFLGNGEMRFGGLGQILSSVKAPLL